MAHWHEADDVPVSYHHVVVIFTLPVAPLNGTCLTSERETGPDYTSLPSKVKASLSRGIPLNICTYHCSSPNMLREYLVS